MTVGMRPMAIEPVTVRPVSTPNWEQALELGVLPDQLHYISDFAPPAAIGLIKAYIRPEGSPAAPLAVYAGDVMVGFLLLTYEPSSAYDYWVNHFFIDARYQRRGYGLAALAALVAWLRAQYPHCRGLGLSVEPTNMAAERLYSRFGFEDAGYFSGGERVYRYTIPQDATG
jgi:diamine N-acetyltransferase